MIDSDAVTAGLVPVREVLQSDGDTARLRLVLETAGCAECVLPRPMLEAIALQMMQPLVPGLSAVAIDDPRES
jgi:predicted aspartyl protease